MIREKIQKMLQKESFYIVFSIIVSIALWTYVAYGENPDSSVPISGIPIVFENEEYLNDAELVLTGVDRETMNLQFVGKRNNISRLSNSNTTLKVDLSEIVKQGGTPGMYQLSYEVNYPSNVDSSGISIGASSVRYVAVTVENLVTKEIPVRGNYDGGVAEGFRAEPMEFSPEYITISGPEAAVKDVKQAWVTVQRENISSTVEAESPVILMDESGKAMSHNGITLSDETVVVRIPVVVVKDVALAVKLTYGNSATEDNVIQSISPQTITLSGEAEILDGINQIVLGTIDLTSFAENLAVPMQIVLPNSVENVSGLTTALVEVQIRGVDTSRVTTTNISVKNETSGYRTEIITQSLEVLLRGKDASALSVMAENVRVVADLAELGNTAGTFSVPAKVYIDGTTTVDAIGDYKVTVQVVEE